MSKTGTYVYRDGTLVKVSDRPPVKGTPMAAVRSFQDNVMQGYRRCEERGQRFLGRREGIERIWQRAAKAAAT